MPFLLTWIQTVGPERDTKDVRDRQGVTGRAESISSEHRVRETLVASFSVTAFPTVETSI